MVIMISKVSGTFPALGVRGRGMIENRSFNLAEFCVKMRKMNCRL